MTEKRHLDFVFLCDKSFEALDGNDEIMRNCTSCGTNVYDLDQFTDDELQAFLAAADDAGMELCARLTVRAEPRLCSEYMRPGTYTGRTKASYRRTTAPGRSTDMRAVVERYERAAGEVTRILGEIRKRIGTR
jgi:hypothetical protein